MSEGISMTFSYLFFAKHFEHKRFRESRMFENTCLCICTARIFEIQMNFNVNLYLPKNEVGGFVGHPNLLLKDLRLRSQI